MRRLLALLLALLLLRPPPAGAGKFDGLPVIRKRGDIRRAACPSRAACRTRTHGDGVRLTPIVPKPLVAEHKRAAVPRLQLVEGFLSAAEAQGLIELALPRLDSSILGDPRAATERTEQERRSSSSATLDSAEMLQEPLVATIMRRAAALAGVPLDTLEPLQIVRYLPGEFYAVHHDAWPPRHTEVMGGNRNTTLFIYLTELPAEEQGGSTIFPDLGVKVRPAGLGGGAMWLNLLGDQPGAEYDLRMKHIGEPPSTVTKFGLNVWMWDRKKPGEPMRLHDPGGSGEL